MDLNQFIKDLRRRLDQSSGRTITFTDEEIDSFNPESAERVMLEFTGLALMKLPRHEIQFFEWIKKEDPKTWDDLWADEEEPYIVSIDFLEDLLPRGHGFMICDLEDNNNFWFSKKQITHKGLEATEPALKKLVDHKKMNIEEMLLAEIYVNSIDIWHFAYNYKIPLAVCKKAVAKLVGDKNLTHLKKSKEIAIYL